MAPVSGWTYAGAFSGVGMLEFACEQLGGHPVFMCESEPFCQRVLRRRFPGVPLIEDVRELDGTQYTGLVDGFVFGFPCQDISSAGKGAGIKGTRSGLWKEGFRIISEMRPKMVLIENVPVLKTRGLDVVLCDLWSIGYHAEWDIISAAAVGAPHLRERIWIVARPAEIAHLPVYGEPARDRKGEVKSFSLVGKLPRAGRMGKELHELVPVAVRKTKRKYGWSYWTGVNLFADSGPRLLWPSSSSRDHKDTGDLNCVPEKSLLPRRVFHVEQGQRILPSPKATDADRGGRGDLLQVVRGNPSPSGHFSGAMLPTPNAYGNGNGPEEHIAKKAAKCGGPRFTITDLNVIARNDFRQANGRLWPTTTTTTDAKAARNETARRTDPDSKHHSGRTLLDAIIIEHAETARIQGAIDASDEIVPTFAPGSSRSLLAGHRGGSREQWPTPTARLGTARGAQSKRFFDPARSNDLDDAVAARGVNGSLNPSWVSWLMGMPLWWVDPTVPTEFTTLVPWDQEPLHVAPRVATGIPMRSQQLRAIGNSVVWMCAYYALSRALAATPQIGRAEEHLALAA